MSPLKQQRFQIVLKQQDLSGNTVNCTVGYQFENTSTSSYLYNPQRHIIVDEEAFK